MEFRRPSPKEFNFIEFLINQAIIPIASGWEIDLLVCPMSDGGMGSLKLSYPSLLLTNNKRTFGQEASKFQFTDSDGIDVLASIYLDKESILYELDIWKVDFSPIVSIPEL